MSKQQQTVISGFNEQIETMRQEEKEKGIRYLVSLTKFNTVVEVVYSNKPLSEIVPLTTETYAPSGWTALYDAIGKTIDTAQLGETDTIVTIFTDGQDNKSVEWKKDSIKILIELRQRENKWGFVYFGANQDAWAAGSSLGIANTVNYTMENTDGMLRSMGAVRATYTTSAMTGNYANLNNLTCDVDKKSLTS